MPKTVAATFCLETPASGWGRVACGDRQKVAVTVFTREDQRQATENDRGRDGFSHPGPSWIEPASRMRTG